MAVLLFILQYFINIAIHKRKMALIVGHSHVKYFHQYLSTDNIQSLSWSGSKIEDLWPKIEDIVCDYKVIAIHTGGNNIQRDGADEVLEKLEDLCNRIHDVNPSCQILLSAILPVAQSGFDNSQKSEELLQRFNNIANEVNQTLKTVTQKMSTTSFVDFPQYVIRGQVQRQLLSKDGIHLSFQGTKYVVSTIEDQMYRALRQMRGSCV